MARLIKIHSRRRRERHGLSVLMNLQLCALQLKEKFMHSVIKCCFYVEKTLFESRSL